MSRWSKLASAICGVVFGTVLTLVAVCCAADPLVRVTYQARREPEATEPQDRTIEGRVRVQAVDGGILLEDRAGVLWPIQASQSPKSEPVSETFLPLTAEELSITLRGELGPSFEAHQTPHYLIISNTSPEFSQWSGQLFERLYAAFDRFWTERKQTLHAPEYPLVIIVFENSGQFEKFQRDDASNQVATAQGYYNAKTNRIALYDTTTGPEGDRPASADEVRKRALRNPGAIATVIHEAVHQLSFNRGLQTRYADNPIWYSEGLAMYFETPDLDVRSGWSTIGQINPTRLKRYRTLTRDRPLSVRGLVSTNDRFQDPQGAVDAYAEAWALHFYLIRRHKEQYMNYLKTLSSKRPLRWDSPEQRLEDFESAFGTADEVEAELRKFMNRLPGGR